MLSPAEVLPPFHHLLLRCIMLAPLLLHLLLPLLLLTLLLLRMLLLLSPAASPALRSPAARAVAHPSARTGHVDLQGHLWSTPRGAAAA
jgi:hypothetical protein